jgi:hypothetical protein
MNSKQPKQAKKVGGQVQPKSKRVFMDAEAFTKALKKRSQWFQSLMDPISGAGARIPDPSGYKTTCFQMVKRVTVPVGVAGVSGIRVTDLYPMDSGATVNTAGNFANFQITNGALANASNLNWSDGTTTGSSLYTPEVNGVLSAGATSLASLIRPVSSAIYASYTGTSLSDAGTFVSYVNPAGMEASSVADSRLRSLNGSSLLPVKANRVAISRWLPIQRSPSATAAGLMGTSTRDYRTFTSGNRTPPTTVNETCPCEFGVYMVGGTASTGSVEFVIVTNYEFTPRFAQSGLIEASPSPQDPLEENFVMSTIEVKDATGSLPMRAFSEVPSASSVTKAEKVEESGPLAALTGAIGFLGPILEVAGPLLAALI